MPSIITRRRIIVPSVQTFDARDYGLGTLRADFDATKLGLADSTAVATWADTSGNGNDATQGTAGNRPVYKANILNGMPGVLFTRTSSHWMAANGLAAVQSGTDLPFTVILAVQQTTNLSVETFCAWGRSSSANPFSTVDASSTSLQFQRRDDASVAKTPISTGVSLLPIIYTFGFTGTTAFIWRNTVPAVMGVSDGDLGAMTFDQFAIGALNRTSASNFLDGYIFRLIVYASFLSSGDRQAVETGLGKQWGIIIR